jgi:hypothetical protein
LPRIDYYAAIQDGKPQSLNVANPEVASGKEHRQFLDRNPRSRSSPYG